LNTKIQRISNEIAKTKVKIQEQQARLRDLERQKTEIENLEIVNAVRAMNISFAELAELLRQTKPSSLAALATSGQVGSMSENNNDEEDI